MSARRKKHEEHEEHVNHERWLITYADMITLLMVLFIVLFAIGQTDLAKYEKLKEGFAGSSSGGAAGGVEAIKTAPEGKGILDGGPKPSPDGIVAEKAAQEALQEKKMFERALEKENQSLIDTQTQINNNLTLTGLNGDVKTEIVQNRGLVVTIVSDQVLFAPGRAELQPGGAAVLDGISSALGPLSNPVIVEGHTDSRPISSAIFPSNWELSTGRAGSVVRYLADRSVASTRLSAAGYADQKPVGDNGTDEGRARNRRVEIVVLSTVDGMGQEG